MRINLKNVWKDRKSPRYQIFIHLIDEFCSDYDVIRNDMVSYFVQSDEHLTIFQNYLIEKGYKVSLFSLPGAKKGETISWGLEFDDQCESIVLLKIKYLE